MNRLLRNQYYVTTDASGWDLATGEHVRFTRDEAERPCSVPPIDTLLEALDSGQDGRPRQITLRRPENARLTTFVRQIASTARSRGYLPIAASLYLRLRDVLAAELQDRSLVLISVPDLRADAASAALRAAAACSPRPHVLVTIGDGASLAAAPRGLVVREARAVYAAQWPLDVRRHLLRAARAPEFVNRGRHAAAERLLRDVASSLVRRRMFTPGAQTLIQLGRLLLERGRAAQADEVLGEAARHAEAGDDERAALEARIWQAAARTDAGHLSAAESLCRAVLMTPGLESTQRLQAHAALARVLHWQKRLAEALEVPLAGSPEDNPLHVAFASATAVRILLAAGRVFDAGVLARSALALAPGNDTIVLTVARMAHFRAVVASGDLVIAERALADLRQAALDARAPLRLARARLAWAHALRRAGQRIEAAREDGYLRRVSRVAPPLLRRAIGEHLTEPAGDRDRVTAGRSVLPGVTASLIEATQGEDDDRAALQALLQLTARELRASRLEIGSAEAGPVSVLLVYGSGLPGRLGGRVLESGIAIGPESADGAHECGVPVRLGTRLRAALVARWAVDRDPPPGAREFLEIGAAIAAPRVESLLAASRETSRAAGVIPELVGGCALMEELRKAVARAASAPFAVLIEGESGVGKELVARAVHHLGPRRERRFCDVNCAALPDELIESELFGHARGAFTGAVAERAGLFEDADGGTLFLDEVADLSLRAQAKLLRAIQQQEVRRIGESFSRKVDVRIVSAANRDMRAESDAGRFRQDLLYRLQVIRIRIPPLRDRPEDIPLLAAHFWRDTAARVGTTAVLAHATLTALTRYYWPGNVRELQNVMAALAVAAPSRGQVRPSLLPAAITGAASVTAVRLADARVEFERRFIEVALARAGGSRSRAARDLGISRQGLLKILARLGLGA